MNLSGAIDIATVIDRLELGTDYELVGESRISLEAFQEYQNSGMNDDFMMLLLDYDFVLGNSTDIQSSFFANPNSFLSGIFFHK